VNEPEPEPEPEFRKRINAQTKFEIESKIGLDRVGLDWVGEDGGLLCINTFSKFGLGLGLGLVHDFRTRDVNSRTYGMRARSRFRKAYKGYDFCVWNTFDFAFCSAKAIIANLFFSSVIAG